MTKKIKTRIRKGLLSGIVLMMTVVMFSIATPVAASTGVPGGEVSGTWTISGSPYLINGDIAVPTGETLTIEPGVVVNFESAYAFTVNGTLLAEGTESAPILFGGGHETAGWGGIRMIDASDSSRLTHVVVEKGRATSASSTKLGGQVVTREKHRKFVRGVDTVLILDQDVQPVAGATVTAVYSGPNSGQVSGTTGADGTVVLTTPWVRKTKDVWCFEVTDVSKDGYTYNGDANVVTTRCEGG